MLIPDEAPRRSRTGAKSRAKVGPEFAPERDLRRRFQTRRQHRQCPGHPRRDLRLHRPLSAHHHSSSGPRSSGTVASHTARTLTDLADHIGTEQQHRDALIRWDPEKYKRVHALTYADLGDSLAAQARADEAVAAWAQALTLMEGMASGRTRKAITSLRSTLSIYLRRKVPGAAELARRAREALA
jgi:hypothetical protein